MDKLTYDDLVTPVPADPPPIFLQHLGNATLYPHQRAAVHWMRNIESGNVCGGVLADETGMGKTLTIAALVDASPRTRWTVEPTREEIDTNLIICTRETMSQWVDTFEKFGTVGNKLSVKVYQGTRHDSLDRIRQADVLLVDYAMACAEFHYNQDGTRWQLRSGTVQHVNSFLNQVEFHRVVVDEVQYMDNGGRAPQVIRGIHAAHRWAVSATPLKNGAYSLASLLDFVAPSYARAANYNE